MTTWDRTSTSTRRFIRLNDRCVHMTDPDHVSADEFLRLYHEVRAWAPPGDGNRIGALRHLTPERIAAAGTLVRTGIPVSLGRKLDTHPGPENPSPAEFRTTVPPQSDGGGASFSKDYVGVDYHNDTHSHVDALNHVVYDGLLYGGTPVSASAEDGVALTIEVLRHGLVGRGVLLDVPRVRGVRWLEPGQSVITDDLLAAEHAQGVRVQPGDILLIRTGHDLRIDELPPFDPANAKPGLHPWVARFLAERQVAALGSDGNSDTAPPVVQGLGYPIHVLAINALGIHLLDYLSLADLVAQCEATARWDFLFVAAPLRIPDGTGSPVNPIAIF